MSELSSYTYTLAMPYQTRRIFYYSKESRFGPLFLNFDFLHTE